MPVLADLPVDGRRDIPTASAASSPTSTRFCRSTDCHPTRPTQPPRPCAPAATSSELHAEREEIEAQITGIDNIPARDDHAELLDAIPCCTREREQRARLLRIRRLA